jgi:hypothetical protein
MITTKSIVAAFLCLSLFSVACKTDTNQQTETDYLDITSRGYSVAGFQKDVIRITANAAYKVEGHGNLTQLSAAIADSLTPYLKTFPLKALIAEGDKSFSMRGAADNPYWVFTAKGAAKDSARTFEIDFGGGPAYMNEYLGKLKQTLNNCKL